jgi:crotonobetainyl-CoA:carnitine CoA-transferase CaiB-like acyl-CoA transferase
LSIRRCSRSSFSPAECGSSCPLTTRHIEIARDQTQRPRRVSRLILSTKAGGDETRHWAPLVGGTGAAFLSVNSGKRSLALNLRVPAARKIVAELAAKSDIVVQSFAPGVAEKLGVDRKSLAGTNDRLIYCSISGFGQSGRPRNAPGYDVILQAFTGMMALNGEENGEAVRLPASPIDQATAQFAIQGILAALLELSRSGSGATVEVSLLETAIKMLGPTLQAYWASGKLPKRYGSGHPSISPYQVFETKDRPVLVAIANEKFWRLFCEVAELQAFVADPRFRTNPDRVKHSTKTVKLVSDAMRRHTAGEWLQNFSKAGIPAAPLNTVGDLFEQEHVIALNMLSAIEHCTIGRLSTVAEPILFDGRRPGFNRAPPALGEHTISILADELGYSAQRIEELKGEQALFVPA